MRKVVFMLSLLLTLGLFSACSSDAGDEIMVDPDGGIVTNYNTSDVPSFDPSDVNKLRITWSSGYTDTCRLYRTYCGLYETHLDICDNVGSHLEYPMVFTAFVKNSHLFEAMQFDIRNLSPIKVEDLRVGDTFVDIPYGPGYISLKAWGGMLYGEVPSGINGVIPYAMKGGTQGGVIQVVDKKTSNDGKTRITLSLQDLKFYEADKELKYNINFKLNGLIEFEVLNDGIYPKNKLQEPTMEELTTPTDGLVYFMMDALSNEYQGRHVLFSEGTGAQECLIINSKEELKEVYKGNWDGYIDAPFNSCSLVIGHTYGEDGSVTLGDFDLADNGDAYQLNLTLNNNVNINYVYSPGYVDLYFWKLIPKVVSKPVVFNRINQDVSIDPLGANTPWAKMQRRWFLESYSDAEGTGHQVSDFGDEHYAIEFKGNGTFEAHTPTNDFSGDYGLPYTLKLTNSENFNCDDLHYGVFSVRDWTATNVNDDDPISKAFMRIIPNATQFKLWSTDFLVIRLSDKEYLFFFREGMKSYYGL